MACDLETGRPRELVCLAGYECREGESGIETCLLAAASRSGDRRAMGRGDGRRRDVVSVDGVGNRQGEPKRTPNRHRRKLLDASREAFLDPLQHEPIGRYELEAVASDFQPQRPDPRVELLRRQLALERVEASLPERRW